MQAITVVFLLWLAWKLRFIVILLFIAFMATVVLQPIVRQLRKIKVPAAFAILLPIGTIVGLLTLVYFFVAPTLVSQIGTFIDQFPRYIERLPAPAAFDLSASSIREFISGRFGDVSQLAFTVTQFLVEAIIAVVTILVVTIYWLTSYDTIKKTLLSYLPKGGRKRLADIWRRIEIKFKYWVIAQLLLSLAVGVLTWIVLLIVGLPFSEVLALVAGLLEVVPTIGPIAAAIPAIAIGFSISFTKGIVITLVYIGIQQFENHVLSPLLMGKTVRLHPIVIIVSLLIGATLLGLIGALLAVPVALVISAVVDSYRNEPLRGSNKQPLEY